MVSYTTLQLLCMTVYSSLIYFYVENQSTASCLPVIFFVPCFITVSLVIAHTNVRGKYLMKFIYSLMPIKGLVQQLLYRQETFNRIFKENIL